MKKLFVLFLIAALAASSLSAISVSADAQDDSAPAYTVTEAQYAAWAEYGVSAEELDSLIARSTFTNIYDFAYFANCSSYSNNAKVKIETYYDPATTSFMGADVLPNISNSSNSTSDYGSNKKYTVEGKINGTGKIFRFKFTRNSSSVIVNPPTTNQCILGYSVSFTVGYGTVTVDTNDLIGVGDADDSGVIDISDVMTITNFVAGIPGSSITDAGRRAADVDGDGQVTMDDAWLVQQYIAHINDHVWG